ncbi:MAG: STAS/SEC14 domain-containing protein [Armatimonadota bacterium]
MIRLMDESTGNTVGVEIYGEYTKDDVLQLEKIFNDLMQEGHEKINILFKIDQLNLEKITPEAFIEDSRYALENLPHLGHIAVVGHSSLEKMLIGMDNMIFGDPSKGLEEKYFDIADMDKAWEFARGAKVS